MSIGCRRYLIAGFLMLAQAVAGPSAVAQDSAEIEFDFSHGATWSDSPRHTLATFLYLRDAIETQLLAYRKDRSFRQAEKLQSLREQFDMLIDLRGTASVSRRDVSAVTGAHLLDIFGRIDLPDLADVPSAEAFDGKDYAHYQIPGTPIRITRVNDGLREGEFLFNALTIHTAPRFAQGLRDIPLRSRLGIESWIDEMPQITGPLIPAFVVASMPEVLRKPWFGTPIWKVIALALYVAGFAVLLISFDRRLVRREPGSRLSSLALQSLRPVCVIVAVWLFFHFEGHIHTSGSFSTVVAKAATIVAYIGSAWLFWLVVRFLMEWVILSPRIPDQSFNANLLRLVANCLGFVGVVLILAFGGHELGLPVLSMVAGLGIGGFAVALAVRPILENLISGLILYIDKPIQVGDFCSFGDRTATVEAIGVRSTQLRALDRTLISVPNAQFADMQIINWAKCDEMLIDETIGLRYETTPDQLRFVLGKLRELLHAHPRINSNTVRVRFWGYGDSSLNINVRIYAKTREWNDFFAIREDVLLRIADVVSEAGSGFAFPSTTVYMGQDTGIDTAKGDEAENRTRTWRATGKLPFPRIPPDRLAALEDTLDYPPKGSPDANRDDYDVSIDAERLSAEPLADDGETAPEETDDGAEQRQRD